MNNVEKFEKAVREFLVANPDLVDNLKEGYRLREFDSNDDVLYSYCFVVELCDHLSKSAFATGYHSRFIRTHSITLEYYDNPLKAAADFAQGSFGTATFVIGFDDYYIQIISGTTSYGYITPEKWNGYVEDVPEYKEVFPKEKTITVFE